LFFGEEKYQERKKKIKRATKNKPKNPKNESWGGLHEIPVKLNTVKVKETARAWPKSGGLTGP